MESAGKSLTAEARRFIDCCGVTVNAASDGPDNVKVKIRTLIYATSFVTWHHTWLCKRPLLY